MNFKNIVLAATIAVASTSAVAETNFDKKNAYVGGGLGMNSLSGFDDAMGFQFFGGYTIPKETLDLGKVGLAAEVGYMTSGDFETTFFGTTVDTSADGLWASAVFDYGINEQFKAIGRAGLDFGDDDGLLIGGGVEYAFDKKIGIRGEYVMRDNVDSLQVNVTYQF